MYILGLAYLGGQGVPRDPAEAVTWFRKAGDSGCANAMITLGRLYGEGKVVRQDLAQAVASYRKAADLGSVHAMSTLGAIYRDGKVARRDYVEAHMWLSVATAVPGVHQKTTADARDRVAKLMTPAQIAEAQTRAREWRQTATVQTSSPADVQAVETLRDAAAKGDAPAMVALGNRYVYGQGVPQDSALAVEWYRKAVDSGDVGAMNQLGVMYVQAATLYRTAADLGSAAAMNNLGRLYLEGRGVPQDYVEAYKWMSLATARAPAEQQKMAAAARDGVAKLMTPDQIAEGQKRAREWRSK
jgi:hypothetical protein